MRRGDRDENTFTGLVSSTTNPTGGSGVWSAPVQVSTHRISGVACLSAGLCLAGDVRGGMVGSTSPTGESWTRSQIDGTTDQEPNPGPLVSVSCWGAGECEALETAGNVLSSSNPAGGAWSTAVAETTTASGPVPQRIGCALGDRTVRRDRRRRQRHGRGGTASINGNVTEQAQGHALPGVTVTVTGTASDGSSVNQSAVTDAGGSYEFMLSSGTYAVTASGDPPGQTTKLEYAAVPCPGKDSGSGSCTEIALQSGQPASADFVYGCGVNGVWVDSVTPVLDQPFGATPGSDVNVTLSGRGFCSGMTVQFGNELAIANVPDADITPNGSSATATVPRLPSTGTVTVKSAARRRRSTTSRSTRSATSTASGSRTTPRRPPTRSSRTCSGPPRRSR